MSGCTVLDSKTKVVSIPPGLFKQVLAVIKDSVEESRTEVILNVDQFCVINNLLPETLEGEELQDQLLGCIKKEG